MQKTSIEWVKNPDGTQGYTSNPIKGKCPMACSYCYARRMYDRFKWNPEPRFDDDVLDRLEMDLIQRKGPFWVFLCSTFEWLWNLDWAEAIYSACEQHPQHRFYLLTKLPGRLKQFSPFPNNIYIGVSVSNQHQYNEALKYLEDVRAKVKFLSIEPLLEHIVIEV